MSGILTRRAFMVTKFQQPCRLKSWCEKNNENKEATIKQASQESLYKDYNLDHCKKTVFCPMTRDDCGKQKQKPFTCKKKTSVADFLGKVIWFCLKGTAVISLVYVTIDVGLWKGSDQTYELAQTMYKRLLEFLDMDESRMPTAAEIKYNAVQNWNKGVRIIFNGLAHPFVGSEKLMASGQALR